MATSCRRRGLQEAGDLLRPARHRKDVSAKGLAQSIIRSAALERLGAPEYFANPTRIDDALKSHIHRQQLHPAYGYEQFVRALHIDDHGATVYRDGFSSRSSTR